MGERAQVVKEIPKVGNAPIRSYNYLKAIYDSRIDALAKHLLCFYAFKHGWEKNVYSKYEEQRVCAHTGISVSTLHKKRKYLVELGWIKVLSRGKSTSPEIALFYGVDDPNFESKSCAKWKPSNKILPPSVVAEMGREEKIDYYTRLNDRYSTSKSSALLQRALLEEI